MNARAPIQKPLKNKTKSLKSSYIHITRKKYRFPSSKQPKENLILNTFYNYYSNKKTFMSGFCGYFSSSMMQNFIQIFFFPVSEKRKENYLNFSENNGRKIEVFANRGNQLVFVFFVLNFKSSFVSGKKLLNGEFNFMVFFNESF